MKKKKTYFCFKSCVLLKGSWLLLGLVTSFSKDRVGVGNATLVKRKFNLYASSNFCCLSNIQQNIF